jgi:pimeloyl-ACP methyl ester carboxylesterase
MKYTIRHFKSLFCITILLSIITNVSAQKVLNGFVKDVLQRPISYCSIGIKNTKIATIADENGHFKLAIPDSLSSNNLIFSAIGFVERQLSTSEIRTFKDGAFVTLEEKIFTMAEVAIKGTKLKDKVVGQRSRPMITFSKMFDQNVPSVEQGNIFEIYEQSVLKAYNFYIIPSSKFTAITLKLNLYTVKNNLPDSSLLRQNITYHTTTTGWQRIDLSPYQLSFNGMANVAVTLQLVAHQSDSSNKFVFGISAKKTLSKDLLFRYQNQGTWETNAGTFIANLELKYNKNDRKAKASTPKESENTSEMKMLVDFYQHREAAAKSGYGRNKKGRFIDIGDAKVYTEEYGEGEPLLLLHGNNGSIADFYLQIPSLSKHFKVIAIDTRGQGRSTDLSTNPYSYDRFAKDLYQITDVLGLKKFSIVGWSDGGNTALSFNLMYPEMVKKVVAIGANLNPSGVKDSLIAVFKKQLETVGQKNNRLIRLMLEQPNITAKQLKLIQNPVLVVAGGDDVIKPEHTRFIAEQIIRAKLEIIPNATHYVSFEQSHQLNQIIVNFLKDAR